MLTTSQISAGNGAFFDKLSLMVMEIGRTAPINQEIGCLVPDSPELQSLVTEYMIRVVSICKEMIKLSNKSSFAQLTTSIAGFDATFGSLSDEAKTLGHVIDKQVALLSAKTSLSEARENRTSRALIRGISSEARRQAREVKLVRFFKNLCAHQQEFDDARANIRQKGTVDWIFQQPDYIRWKAESAASTINLVGKLGSGKSVAMANVVDDLHLSPSAHQERRCAVAYMFYTYGLRQLFVARQMIGSLALQILRSSVLRSAVEDYLEDQQLPDLLHPTVSRIISITSSVLRSLPKPLDIFIVLDGMEECSHDEIKAVALALDTWSALSNTHLLYSSRSSMDTFHPASSKLYRIQTSHNSSDLGSWVAAEARRRGELAHQSQELYQLVSNVLSSGADGM